jgi:hypothetical protein
MFQSRPSGRKQTSLPGPRELTRWLPLDGREEVELVNSPRAGYIQKSLLLLPQTARTLLAHPVIEPWFVTMFVANRGKQEFVFLAPGLPAYQPLK